MLSAIRQVEIPDRLKDRSYATWAAIIILGEGGIVSKRDLANELGITRQTLSDRLAILEAAGLVSTEQAIVRVLR